MISDDSLRGLGFSSCAQHCKGHDVQKIDAGYLYELGAAIRPIRKIGVGDLTRPFEAWSALKAAMEAIDQLVRASIYMAALRTAPNYADKLVGQLKQLMDRIESGEIKENDILSPRDVLDVVAAFAQFEPVMIAELQALSIFFVPPRGAFDNDSLIEAGERLFPDSLSEKVPETAHDVAQGAKCLAFDLPTAAGFHFHRANEAVLRKYFDTVAGEEQRPRVQSMGTLLARMKKLEVGDTRIIAALDNIKDFHRNPLMHPEHTLKDVGEAISLYCAIRSAMAYMLDELPKPEKSVEQAKDTLWSSILEQTNAGQVG
jgi:hypothetical protein